MPQLRSRTPTLDVVRFTHTRLTHYNLISYLPHSIRYQYLRTLQTPKHTSASSSAHRSSASAPTMKRMIDALLPTSCVLVCKPPQPPDPPSAPLDPDRDATRARSVRHQRAKFVADYDPCAMSASVTAVAPPTAVSIQL